MAGEQYGPLGTGVSGDTQFDQSGHPTGNSYSSSQSHFSSELPFSYQSHVPPHIDATPQPSLPQLDHRGPPHGLKANSVSRPWPSSSASIPRLPGVPFPSSALESDDEDDIDLLAPSIVTAPWDKMLSLAEVARLRADGQIIRDDGQLAQNAHDDGSRKTRNHPFDYGTPKEPSKKRRRSGIGDDQAVFESPCLTPWQTHAHAVQDPVELGYCSLQRGRQLFDLSVYLGRPAIY